MHDENREVRVGSGQEQRRGKALLKLLARPLLLWVHVALLVSVGCVGGQSGTEGCEDPILDTFGTRAAPPEFDSMDDGGVEEVGPDDDNDDDNDAGMDVTALGTHEDEPIECVPEEP